MKGRIFNSNDAAFAFLDVLLFYSSRVEESIASFTNHLLLLLEFGAVCLNSHEILGMVLVDVKFHDAYDAYTMLHFQFNINIDRNLFSKF